MATSIYQKRLISKRQEQGLCPTCGKPLDRDGYYCTECNAKHNKYIQETRAFLRNLGICPVCGKEKLFGDEKQCIECRLKANERRKPLTDEQKERYSKHFKIQQKELRDSRSEQGICPRCGKRQVAKGKKKCQICLDYDAYIHRKRTFNQKDIKEYRKENHLCYHCGKEIDREDGQLCQSCLERCKQAGLASGGKNKYWENDNKITFIKS